MKINGIFNLKGILFDNQTTGQTIAKNSFWLGLAEVVNKLLVFVLFIYVARILGATEYGKFNFVISLIYLANILPGLVYPEIVTREFSQDKEKEKEYSALFSLKMLLGLGTLLLLIIISFFVSSDPITRKAIWILALYNFFGAPIDLFHAFFRARQRMEYEAYTKILDASLSTILGFIVIFSFPSFENLSYAYMIESFILLVSVILFFHFKVRRFQLGWDTDVYKRIIRLSWPMALVGVVTAVYTQIDSVIMGSLGQMAANGWYNAASKITKLAFAPTALVSMSFYPVMSRLFKESKEDLQKLWNYQMKIMIMLALPLMVGGIMLAPKIINFIYDQSYSPSILALQILIVMTGIVILYDGFRQILVVANQQKKFFLAVLAGALANLVLNLILIPKFSLYGAALASVAANILILVMLAGFVLGLKIINPFNLEIILSLAGAAISSFAMYLVVSQHWIYQMNLIFVMFLSVAVYFAASSACSFVFNHGRESSFKGIN